MNRKKRPLIGVIVGLWTLVVSMLASPVYAQTLPSGFPGSLVYISNGENREFVVLSAEGRIASTIPENACWSILPEANRLLITDPQQRTISLHELPSFRVIKTLDAAPTWQICNMRADFSANFTIDTQNGLLAIDPEGEIKQQDLSPSTALLLKQQAESINRWTLVSRNGRFVLGVLCPETTPGVYACSDDVLFEEKIVILDTQTERIKYTLSDANSNILPAIESQSPGDFISGAFWSQSGEHLLYWSSEYENWRVLSVQTGQFSSVDNLSSVWRPGFNHYTFSPDEQQIAFWVSQIIDSRDYYSWAVLDVNTNSIRIDQDQYVNQIPSPTGILYWSPDGARVAFVNHNQQIVVDSLSEVSQVIAEDVQSIAGWIMP